MKTRDEAVKQAEECFQFNVPGQEWFFTPLRLVAALENLGLLKVGEPADPMDEKLEAQFKQDGFLRRTEVAYVFNVLDELNLKIVEK